MKNSNNGNGNAKRPSDELGDVKRIIEQVSDVIEIRAAHYLNDPLGPVISAYYEDDDGGYILEQPLAPFTPYLIIALPKGVGAEVGLVYDIHKHS